jgi:hypothetical protein
MARLAWLQVIGPTALFVGISSAEGAARALSLDPSSDLVWSIHFEFFSIFRKGQCALDGYLGPLSCQLLMVGLPLVLTAYYGLVRKRQFPLALASSLSLVYLWLLCCAWYMCDQSSVRTPLLAMEIASKPDVWLAMLLVSTSLLSFVISHLHYLRACKAEIDEARHLVFWARSDRYGGSPVLRRVH